jgi:L-fucose isomerase-like protein
VKPDAEFIPDPPPSSFIHPAHIKTTDPRCIEKESTKKALKLDFEGSATEQHLIIFPCWCWTAGRMSP